MTEKYILVSDDEYCYTLDTSDENYKTLEDFEKQEFKNAKHDGVDIKDYEDVILESANDNYWNWVYSNHLEADTVNDILNTLVDENKQLKTALKNSYINEICENCKHGNYFLSDNFDGGFEGDFECLKKHFGNDHWECDGLTECDEFELEIKGDVE